MRSKLIAAAFASVLLCAPALALAAYNDVTLTTDAIISVGGYTLNVSGSSAVIQSIVVNSGSFSVTLASGSSLTVSSPTRNKLSSDVTSDITASVCTGSASSITLAYSGSGTVTNVITPSATVCSTASSSSSSSAGSSSGGAILPGYTETNPLPGASVVVTTSTATSGLTSEQIRAVVNLLASFGADQATIAGVEAVLAGNAAVSVSAYSFSRDLKRGDTGVDVRALQAYLNAHGFAIAVAGPGSVGNETDFFGSATKAALARFQAANRIAPASGYFGPITRAFIQSGR